MAWRPSQGIEFLMSSGQFSTVEEVAKFLHTAPGLNKVKLGDVIGEQYEGASLARARECEC